MVRIYRLLIIRIMAVVAPCGRSCVTVGVASGAIGGYVGPGEREGGGVVVESQLATAGGMALQAGLALIDIATHIIVFIVHILLIVLMAGNAGEGSIIRRIFVTVGTGFPFTLMLSAVYWEEEPVVQGETRRFPTRVGGMAISALDREARSGVVGIGGCIVVLRVTGKAITGGAGVRTALGVAFKTVGNGVPLGEREELMTEACPCPGESIGEMTFLAIGGKIALCMVGTGGSQVILKMAIVTANPNRLETEQRGTLVAVVAVSGAVRAHQGKPALLMKQSDVGYYPRTWGMAAGAIGAQGVLVHIGMTIGALTAGF